MPSLNVGEYIDECISSVTNQTLKEIEIICIDAGSTDDTLNILKKHAKKDSRITILNSDEKSYGHQVNIGIERAKGAINELYKKNKKNLMQSFSCDADNSIIQLQ